MDDDRGEPRLERRSGAAAAVDENVGSDRTARQKELTARFDGGAGHGVAAYDQLARERLVGDHALARDKHRTESGAGGLEVIVGGTVGVGVGAGGEALARVVDGAEEVTRFVGGDFEQKFVAGGGVEVHERRAALPVALGQAEERDLGALTDIYSELRVADDDFTPQTAAQFASQTLRPRGTDARRRDFHAELRRFAAVHGGDAVETQTDRHFHTVISQRLLFFEPFCILPAIWAQSPYTTTYIIPAINGNFNRFYGFYSTFGIAKRVQCTL